MKHARLVWFSFALWAASATASLALACETKTAANTSAHSCSAAAAATASNAVKCSGAQASSASAAQCPHAHGAAVTAVLASTAGAAGAAHHCSASASAASSCKGAASASAKTNSSHCEGEGLVKMADATLHTDCDGCSDMAHTEQEIMNAGGKVQIVQLKNGVMYMYTAESSAGVRAVQAAVSHRNEHLAAWTTAGDHVHLCDECKTMRGAAASGKLTREVVNIEGGCLTLVTSTDPGIVAKLHSMAQAASTRSKI